MRPGRGHENDGGDVIEALTKTFLNSFSSSSLERLSLSSFLSLEVEFTLAKIAFFSKTTAIVTVALTSLAFVTLGDATSESDFAIS
jgi:hypothetical protein